MRIIQISCLGNLGRFGNQLFQYAFAQAYALKYNAILETPKWVGQELFGINDKPISKKLPKTQMDITPWGEVNIDLFGHFQNQQCFDLYKNNIKETFKFNQSILSQFSGLRCEIAAHLRRGDYLKYKDVYCTVTDMSYIRACDIYWLDKNKITWLSEDHKRNTKLPQYIDDFLVMMYTNVLLRSNSTYSWWAGTLGNARVFSPLVDNLTGLKSVEFVPGNHPKFMDPINNPNYPTIHTDLY